MSFSVVHYTLNFCATCTFSGTSLLQSRNGFSATAVDRLSVPRDVCSVLLRKAAQVLFATVLVSKYDALHIVSGSRRPRQGCFNEVVDRRCLPCFLSDKLMKAGGKLQHYSH